MSYSHHHVLVLSQDLQDFAWSAPMRDLAAKVGLSDAGLKKLLKGHGVATPPQGYWNKVLAGKPVPRCPRVPPRGPGQTGRVRVDARLAGVLPAAEPISWSGPFASAAVPEDLDELYERQLKAVGRVAVPRTLERFHPGLMQLSKQEERRRAKFAETSYPWDAPRFDGALDQRRLRILNALFMALSKRGHGGGVHDRDGQIDATALVGDTRVGLELAIADRHRTVMFYGRERPAPDLPASTPLRLVIGGSRDRPAGEGQWLDDAAGKLEAKLAEVTARVVVAGEALFRRGLKEAEERAEQFRRWEDERRREETERRNAERLKQLRASGDLLRQADDLRALLARVRGAVLAGALDVEPAALAEWEAWASAEADRLDPVVSGQVLAHLVQRGGKAGGGSNRA